MTAALEVGLLPSDLKLSIQDRIVQRTRVHIRTLVVEVAGDRVIITGWVPSFYLKQLVIEGVLDVIGRAGTHRIEVNVQVPSDSAGSDLGAG
jgi:hypothetical protein